MTDMIVEKANEKSYFGKNMTFKKLVQQLLTKASDFGICGSVSTVSPTQVAPKWYP